MLLTVVDATNIVDVDPAVTVLVELLEGLSDASLTVGVHLSADSAQKFVVGDLSVAGNIEEPEEDGDLALVEVQLEVVHGLGKLVLVESLGAIIVHDFELSLETDDTTSAAGTKLLLEL